MRNIASTPSGVTENLYDVLNATLEEGAFSAHFQPIVSIKQMACVGVEALARFRFPGTGRNVSPADLFEFAHRHNKVLELDRACRRKAFETFAQQRGTADQLLLFFNFEAAVLDRGVQGSGVISQAVCEYGLKPETIVIEINESAVEDLGSLLRFANAYRKQGFLIAMDDVGKAHSSLQRVAILKPDVLKLDRSIFQGIAQDGYKQEIFRALVRMGQKIGALILSEAIETEEEAVSSALLGSDLMQGYLFGQPRELELLDVQAVRQHVAGLSEKYATKSASMSKQRQSTVRHFVTMFHQLCQVVGQTHLDQFGHDFSLMPDIPPQIESLYGLTLGGMQNTPTVILGADSGRVRNKLYEPAQLGANHKLKEYYLSLMTLKKDFFITDPYISLATGSLCRTFSGLCTTKDGKPMILCMDVIHEPGM